MDFPIPGAPPTRMRLPGTTPPPSSASNSTMPVKTRATSPLSIARMLRGPFERDGPLCRLARFFWSGASANEFQASQAGQRPSQRLASLPQAVQKKSVLAFAIPYDCGGSAARPARIGANVPTALVHVAIDGPVASGKSTVARSLAERLELPYIDTGAMYRALGYLALAHGVDSGAENELVTLLERFPLRFEGALESALGYRIFAGPDDIGERLFDDRIAVAASSVAGHPRVREALVAEQRRLAQGRSVVMVGRDIGTVVLPRAPFKVFLTASVDARTDRRYADFVREGIPLSRESLHREILARDEKDRSRPLSPLVAAHDARTIDSSDLSVDDVVAAIANWVQAAR